MTLQVSKYLFFFYVDTTSTRYSIFLFIFSISLNLCVLLLLFTRLFMSPPAENDIRSEKLKSSGIMSSMFGDKVTPLWEAVQKEAVSNRPHKLERFRKMETTGWTRRFDIQVPPTKRYNFPVPTDIDYKYARQILEFDWDQNDVGGILRKLDLKNSMCMHLLNNVPGLKVVIFRNGKDKKRALKFGESVCCCPHDT